MEWFPLSDILFQMTNWDKRLSSLKSWMKFSVKGSPFPVQRKCIQKSLLLHPKQSQKIYVTWRAHQPHTKPWEPCACPWSPQARCDWGLQNCGPFQFVDLQQNTPFLRRHGGGREASWTSNGSYKTTFWWVECKWIRNIWITFPSKYTGVSELKRGQGHGATWIWAFPGSKNNLKIVLDKQQTQNTAWPWRDFIHLKHLRCKLVLYHFFL